MEVEANGQSSINLLETWRCHSTGGCHDDLAVSPLDLASNDIAQVPRCPDADPLFGVLLGDGPYSAARHGAGLRGPHPKAAISQAWTPRTRLNLPSTFSFAVLDARTKSKPLDIRLQPKPAARRGTKRRRVVSDVDGFNTAGLSVKKRRLRSELITSRLSQPYSQPATHILNREGQESGDKRFLKMATTIDVARRVAHHATSFLRFSTMNRLRRRLSLGQPATGVRRYEQEIAAVASKITGKTAWRPQNLMDSSAGRSIRPYPVGNGLVGPPGSVLPTRPQGSVMPPRPPPLLQHAKPTPCRLSKLTARPLSAAEAAATKKRTSPRIHPLRSPELRPTGPMPPLDDLEEDSFAYMHPADDDWDDAGDDQESVYSDFSVLFEQSGGNSDGVADGEDDRSYEEYLDELDGICWMSR